MESRSKTGSGKQDKYRRGENPREDRIGEEHIRGEHIGGKDISIRWWWELTEEAGEDGARMALNFSVTGVSMVPTIRNHLDTVVVLPRRRIPKVGDIVLFRKKNMVGDYILHRVLEVEEEGVLTIGDGNLTTDGWTRMEDVYGIAAAIKKGERTLDCGSPLMIFWGRLWLRLLPVRGPLLKLFGWIAARKQRNLSAGPEGQRR